MKDILEKLIAFPTVSGDESNDAALQYISEYLKHCGLHVKHYRSNGFGSLVATTRKGELHPKLLLAAHIDVVPAPSEIFSLRTQKGKFTGRGVFDMKFAVASYLYALDKLPGSIKDYDFGIMITTDEELDGQNGTKYLLDRGYGADICLLPDGADGWHIEAKAKGVWHVKASASGESAHGSRPWEGENAADKLLQFVAAIQQQTPKAVQTADTTCEVTQLFAGTASNQIPDEAWAIFDVRFLNGAFQDLKRQFRTLAKAYDITLTTEMFGEALTHDMESPYVTEWERVVKLVRGSVQNEYALSFGASDARYLVAKGIPCIITRPDGGSQHADDEWIDQKGFFDFTECVINYIENIARTEANTVDRTPQKRYNSSKLPETATDYTAK